MAFREPSAEEICKQSNGELLLSGLGSHCNVSLFVGYRVEKSVDAIPRFLIQPSRPVVNLGEVMDLPLFSSTTCYMEPQEESLALATVTRVLNTTSKEDLYSGQLCRHVEDKIR